MRSHLWEEAISAEREIGKFGSGTYEPCLILGTFDNEEPGGLPYFLIVKTDGTLDTAELNFLRTNWRYEDGKWIDTNPLFALEPLMVGDIERQYAPGEVGETGEEG